MFGKETGGKGVCEAKRSDGRLTDAEAETMLAREIGSGRVEQGWGTVHSRYTGDH